MLAQDVVVCDRRRPDLRCLARVSEGQWSDLARGGDVFEGIAREDGLLGVEDVVSPDVEAVVLIPSWLLKPVVRGGNRVPGHVLAWIKLLENVGRHRTDPVRRNDVTGEGLAGERGTDRAAHARKVAGAPGVGRHGYIELALGAVAQPLEIAEEEGFVPDDGSADGKAEVVRDLKRRRGSRRQGIVWGQATLARAPC